MNVTAAKIGSAPLTADWGPLASVPQGQGPTARRHQPDPTALHEAWERLKARFTSGEIGFYNAPSTEALCQAGPSQALAKKILENEALTDVLFLGIGGSALGPITVLSALRSKVRRRPGFHFVENPDAEDWRHTLRDLKPEHTLVISVTKSGTTFETLAQTLLALEWLGKDRWQKQFVGITDPQKGELRAFCREQNLPVLDIAPSLGGRFSVFSPVGLLPMALAGLSI
ncbi:MAG TPA: hypothetical protein VL588_10670, partial [Bdellovibrionota bacterium]|nr:hypothetical protein [Bdellovibrionota bacterium]